MTQHDDEFPEVLRKAARDYNEPPQLSAGDFDKMWRDVETAAFPKETFHVGRSTSDVKRRFSVRTFMQLAAVLVLGVAIGRSTARPGQPTLVVGTGAATTDSLAVPEPYQSTTSQYLGQTAALLAMLPSEVRGGRADDRFMGRAHDLLLTTRLLLDSPAAADPRVRTLLDDLELVLAQIVRLQSDQSRSELDLIRQALEQRDVLPRLRSAVADISADN